MLVTVYSQQYKLDEVRWGQRKYQRERERGLATCHVPKINAETEIDRERNTERDTEGKIQLEKEIERSGRKINAALIKRERE